MSTPAQEALAEGFSALAEVHGQTWTIGGASVVGVFSSQSVPDGLGGRIVETALLVEVAALGLMPKQGAIITCEDTGETFRFRESRPATPGYVTLILASPIK